MVEVSFDLDEETCKILEEIAKYENKSENEVVSETIEMLYSRIEHSKDNEVK